MEPQLAEAWDQGDDWRGVTSAKERRKRQNRLHQRAYRKKKHLEAFSQSHTSKPQTSSAGAIISTTFRHQIATAHDAQAVSKLKDVPIFLRVIKCMGLSHQVLDFLQTAYFHWSLNNPVPRDLPTLTRLNAFQALIRNASILEIPVECLETDDCSSPFSLNQALQQSESLQFPAHLSPTTLQRAVAHHAWLDLFPFPALRNSILQGIESGQYDEDRLCDELCCDLLNLETESPALVVIWGDSWDARGWEFSPDFFAKWGVLLKGCSDISQPGLGPGGVGWLLHLILTGATGLVGSGVLQAMLASKEVNKISILSRRPVPAVAASNDPRVNVIIHKDFQKYETQVLNQLQGANGVVWALGISALKVTKEDYIKITKDWPLAAAQAFSSLPPEGDPFRFIYVSRGGATQNPNFMTAFYGRFKGEAETYLSGLRTPRLLIESVHPAGVDASDHDAIKPYIPDPGMAYKVMGAFLRPFLTKVMTSMHSPTEPLGKFLVGMAMGKYDRELDAGGKGINVLPGGLRVLDNWAFRRLYGLD
ncbi:hypothetical protein FDECE_1587 [Fusarium decemcellulare]|nr:hypothetical protein FDECE_1587 [Fusarium decemcellulare]